VLRTALPHRKMIVDGICVEPTMSKRGPKFQVAVRASAGGAFTFDIFTVSGEPRTLQVNSQPYSTPADAARAGYEALAAKGLQTPDIDEAPPVSGEVELGVFLPLVLVTNVIAAIVVWYAVGALLG
jgi:hypothetical protein